MGKSQRVKGSVFERWLAKQLSDALGKNFGVEFKRNIGQARDGGNDIDAGPFVVEAKRRKTLKTLEGWMAQAEAAGRRSGLLRREGRDIEGKLPVVVARADDGRALAVLDLDDFLHMAAVYTSPF